jgi:hypothetical protein
MEENGHQIEISSNIHLQRRRQSKSKGDYRKKPSDIKFFEDPSSKAQGKGKASFHYGIGFRKKASGMKFFNVHQRGN